MIPGVTDTEDHEPVKMGLKNRWNRIHRAGTGAGRHWRVWHNDYECPVCKKTKSHLNNVMAGWQFTCYGAEVKLERRK